LGLIKETGKRPASLLPAFSSIARWETGRLCPKEGGTTKEGPGNKFIGDKKRPEITTTSEKKKVF